jgi:hypothetical protein
MVFQKPWTSLNGKSYKLCKVGLLTSSSALQCSFCRTTQCITDSRIEWDLIRFLDHYVSLSFSLTFTDGTYKVLVQVFDWGIVEAHYIETTLGIV